jgi:hypothetical protein
MANKSSILLSVDNHLQRIRNFFLSLFFVHVCASIIFIFTFFLPHIFFFFLNISQIYFFNYFYNNRKKKDNILDMQFLWTTGLRSSPSSRFLLLKRLQSTKATSQNTKSIFSYGKGGHYFLDRIDPNESVRRIARINNNCLIQIMITDAIE